jgi:hypothetical protein
MATRLCRPETPDIVGALVSPPSMFIARGRMMTRFFLSAFITAHGGTVPGAEAALAASLADGTAYLNIHTTVVPGGEIRGFLQSVPEPSGLILLGIGSLALTALGRGRMIRGHTRSR